MEGRPVTEIYHITHVDNLRSISAAGILCDRRCQAGEVSFTNIAYEGLKAERARTPVPVYNGSTLADYAPFYFAPRSPMLCAISYDRVKGMEGKQKEVVHLVGSCDAVAESGLAYAFTDGHAIMAISNYYRDLKDLDKIDWKVMGARYWNTDGTGEIKRKRQAEFLVANFMPWYLVSEIGVANHPMAIRVQEKIAESPHKPEITIRPDWYY